MTHSKIFDNLIVQFSSKRFVFWHDEDGLAGNELDLLPTHDVQVVMLDDTPSLQIKLTVESADPDSQWLFYSQCPQPARKDDWLLDIRIRAGVFHADQVSIQLQDLGLANLSLRGHLKSRAAFLRAKDRFNRLKKLVLPDDQAEDLDRKMIAVVLRADQPILASLLMVLFTSMEQHSEVDLDALPKGCAELDNFGLLTKFWDWVKAELGYADAAPSPKDLLFRMMVSDLAQGLQCDLPMSLAHFQLPEKAKAANASVFLSQWRNNIAHFASYNTISAEVAKVLDLSHHIASLHAEDMLNAMTFADIEKWIIRDLRDRILSGAGTALETVRAVFTRRRDGHWANPKLAANSDTTKALVCCYEALEAAADFFHLQASFASGFSFASAEDGAEQYRKQLYRFDQDYRHLHRAAEQVDPMGWTLLQSLRENIEATYTGWFLPQLTVAWSKVLEGENGLLQHWQIPGWINQSDFYRREVNAVLENSSVKRVYVIISDAFRFEAAEELSQLIGNRNKAKVTLGAMLGVLPSYTSLGMAALLPHQKLTYKEGSGGVSVLADGARTSSLQDRQAILAKVGGSAFKWEDFIGLGKDKAREAVRDASVVYLYHDRIDMLGDKAVSERQTFEAVSQTLRELNELTGFLIGNLNASTILITADHGFLYQESALDDADHSTLDVKAADAAVTKKRYVIGNKLGVTDKAWCGNTQSTGNTAPEGSMDYWVPKGATRFHFAGGARFVHGSAMPQEIVVPLLSIKLSESEKAKTAKVNIAPLLVSSKVVNNLPRFEFIQTEAVSIKMLPRSVVISLRDGDTPISSEATVTFDSTSASMDERKKSVLLTVKAGSYDAKKDYYLVVRDLDDKIELLRSALKIDLALANDF